MDQKSENPVKGPKDKKVKPTITKLIKIFKIFLNLIRLIKSKSWIKKKFK